MFDLKKRLLNKTPLSLEVVSEATVYLGQVVLNYASHRVHYAGLQRVFGIVGPLIDNTHI